MARTIAGGGGANLSVTLAAPGVWAIQVLGQNPMTRKDISMKAYDFSRSFINFRVDFNEKPPVTLSNPPPFPVNNVRILVDCVCTITNASRKTSQTYVLGASCKTEVVGVPANIWTQPNADFCLTASKDDFLIMKSWYKCHAQVRRYPESLGYQPERQSGAVQDVWTRFELELCPAKGRVLSDAAAIVEAAFGSRPLVARIEYDDGDYHICIEHPVKTINANEQARVYQTDTGPIIVPDLSGARRAKVGRFVEVFDLAYAAFNCPDWAEFIVNVPTSITHEITVNHYSQSRRIENTTNSIIIVD
jgi:hypothetical protein